jgi:hypothetical protein
MKLIKVILFLSFLLLCGMLLHAASNNKPLLKFRKTEKTTKVEVEQNLEFVPGTILL